MDVHPAFAGPLSRWAVGLVLALGALLPACQSGGVGDPCIAEDEYQSQFPGYGIAESFVESRSFQCETRVCMVNHFQGRVSCPYGQLDPATNNLSNDQRCHIPGTAGSTRTEGPRQRQGEPAVHRPPRTRHRLLFLPLRRNRSERSLLQVPERLQLLGHRPARSRPDLRTGASSPASTASSRTPSTPRLRGCRTRARAALRPSAQPG